MAVDEIELRTINRGLVVAPAGCGKTQLITDARARILSNVAGINARRDAWIAHTDFKHALIGGGSVGGGGGTAVAAAGGGDAPAH